MKIGARIYITSKILASSFGHIFASYRLLFTSIFFPTNCALQLSTKKFGNICSFFPIIPLNLLFSTTYFNYPIKVRNYFQCSKRFSIYLVHLLSRKYSNSKNYNFSIISLKLIISYRTIFFFLFIFSWKNLLKSFN